MLLMITSQTLTTDGKGKTMIHPKEWIHYVRWLVQKAVRRVKDKIRLYA